MTSESAPEAAQTLKPPPTCFTDEVGCFGSWAVQINLHTLLLPLLWHNKCNSLVIVSCSVVFITFFYKSSAESSHWHIHAWRVFLIYQKGVWGFLHYGENSSVINCCGLPWPTSLFANTELTSAFFFLNDVPNILKRLLFHLLDVSYCFFLFFIMASLVVIGTVLVLMLTNANKDSKSKGNQKPRIKTTY